MMPSHSAFETSIYITCQRLLNLSAQPFQNILHTKTYKSG